MKMSPLWEKTW